MLPALAPRRVLLLARRSTPFGARLPISANAQAVAQNVQAKVQGVTQVAPEPEPVVEADNDDLREKIEAARERIAAQVVKNAEESQAQVATPIETAPVEAPAEAPAAKAAETSAE